MPNSASRSRLLSASGYGGDLTGLNNNSYLLALWCEMSLRCSLPFTFHFSSSLSVKLCWTHKLMNDKTFLGPTSFGSTQSPLASLWRGPLHCPAVGDQLAGLWCPVCRAQSWQPSAYKRITSFTCWVCKDVRMHMHSLYIKMLLVCDTADNISSCPLTVSSSSLCKELQI